MKDIKRTFRLWMIGTLAFLCLAVGAILTVSWFYMNTLVRSEQQLIRDLFDRKLQEHLAVIPEELYLGLSNLELHKKQLSEVIAGRAELSFEFVGTTLPAEDAQSRNQSWLVTDDESSKQIRIFFGETYLGVIKIGLTWPQSPLLSAFNKIIWISLGAIIVLSAAWLLFLYLIQTKSYTPLLKRLLEFERTQAIGQATLMLAHDFRKPLSMTKVVTKILRSGKGAERTADDLDRMAGQIDNAISHADLLINDVMYFCGSKQPDLKPVSVTAAIGESRQLVFRENSSAQIHIALDLQHRSKISAERTQIVRVISNILENAVQAMKSDGTIFISTEETAPSGKPSTIKIKIRNTGSFIPPDLREKIFELFFTKGKADGTGLGLAICRKMIESHGGTIHCTSSETKGTEFQITLPAGAEAEDYDHAAPGKAAS